MGPPGKKSIPVKTDNLVTVFRNFVKADGAIYDAIGKNHRVDADGDGMASTISFSLNAGFGVAPRENVLSTDADDLAARDRVEYVYHSLFSDSILNGRFDSDLDFTPDETHQDWKGKVDWLGIQYYFQTGVAAEAELIALMDAVICI